MSKLKNIKIEYFIMGLFILMPFVETYRCLFQDTISVGFIALEEFVVLAYIGSIFLYWIYTIYKNKTYKKMVKYVVYFSVALIYIILHYYNLTKFNTAIYPAAEYSLITESYYIIRAYLIPILLMYMIYDLGMSDENFSKTATIVSVIISLFIVVTNLLGISFISYSLENQTILGSIFSWGSLTPKSNFDGYTSKAFFYSANQISALMFSLSPIVVKNTIKKPSFLNCAILGMQILAMIMIGTKTAAIGVLLVVAAMFLVAIVLHLLKLETLKFKKIAVVFTIFIVGGYSLYCVSPVQQKYNVEEIQEEEEVREEVSETVEESEYTFADYIKQNAYYFYINPSFLESYPVEVDEEFWNDIITRDRTLNIDNRKFKVEIIDRVIERNNNSLDKVFGIGYTSYVPYTERDYMYQYFIFGGFGVVLFILPFVFILLYSGINILRNYKQKLTLENCAVGMSLCCYLLIAYLAGHVFGMMLNMLFMGFFAAKLLMNVKRKEE